MAFGKFLGADLASPKGGRATGQLIIGCALGLYFTPVVGHEVVVHWYLLIAAAVFALLLAYASGWFLTRSTGLDGTTALFASVPGGAAEMTILGERFGALPDRVVLAQSLRVMIVVVVVPFLFSLLGVQGVDDYRPAQFGVEASGLLALLVLAATAGALLAKLSVPNAWMLGPLAVAVALTLAEVGLSAIPVWLSNSAQLLLGCALGSGFDRKSLSTAPRFVAMVCARVGPRARRYGPNLDDGARHGTGRHGGDVCHCQSAPTRGAARHRGPRHAGDHSRDHDRTDLPACETRQAQLAGITN
jgi:membrane AbrB-like protein